MIGKCVSANSFFTPFKDYEIEFYSDGTIAVESDYGCYWFCSFNGDGYYAASDSNGKEVVFLVEQHFLLKL